MTTQNAEQDIRLNVLNTLLTTPHRDLGKIYPVHNGMITQDPIFYVRLAAWYNDTGQIRDHKEMFIVNLCLSDFEGHRDVGLAMLRELPPYQLSRVIDFIHGRKKTTKIKDRRTREEVEVTDKFGLFRNVPRSATTEVTRYMKEREADNDWFDSSAMIARKYMKRLYALLHIEPSDRAQAILFDEEPPEGSKLAMLKKLHQAKTAAEQAKVIIENNIPYRVASTVIKAMTPTVLLALIEVMSPQELINNLGSLRKRGAFNNADLKAKIQEKLELAKTDKRVAAMKTSEAAKASGVSTDIQQQLEDVSDAQVKGMGRIVRPTALLIDKSGSMSQAIEMGKHIGSMISAIMDADFYAYAFDTAPYPIVSSGTDVASWEKAMRGIKAGACTSCGAGIAVLHARKQRVEQIIMVTDEGENSSPPFLTTLQNYQKDFGEVHVVFVKTQGSGNKLEGLCQRNGISHDAYQFDGDYYALPNLIPFLTQKSRFDLLMEILDYPLPERKSA